jgi:maleylacetate reductase
MISGTHRHPKQEEVVYGQPAVEAVKDAAAAYGARRVLIVTSRSLGGEGGLAATFATALGDRCTGVFSEVRAHSPREDVVAGAARARELACDLLVAIGGGSVVDATKVMQICLAAGVTRADELDGYRAAGAAALDLAVRMVAVPTTLSAAEFTPFAGVTDTAAHRKDGFYHPLLAPRKVVLDPEMTLETPVDLWCSTGLKAVDHAVEQLCNPERAPYADALAEAGLRRLGHALRETKNSPADLEARLSCQIGMWLAISGAGSGRGMGASHAIGHTLGGMLGVPHGMTSAVMLPAVLRWNESVLGERGQLVASLLGSEARSPADAVARLRDDLGLPATLGAVGVGADRFRAIAEHTMHDRGIRTNPRPIRGPEDIEEILNLVR